MSEKDEPLFPEDILGASQGEDAVQGDIDHAFESSTTDEQNGMLESQRALRAASFGVLAKLQEHGVDQAEELEEMLKAEDPEVNPLRADLAGLALEISEDAQHETEDPEEQRRLKTLAAVAHVAGSLAALSATRMYGATQNDKALKRYLDESLEEADVSANVKQALKEVASEVS